MFDVAVGICALICATPLIGLIAAMLRIASGSPVLFRQTRSGLNGREFVLLKFRTMHRENSGLGVTQAGDDRVTRLGRLLRASKLDELPQLVNVLRGDMSVVGPRPDLPEFWRQTDSASRRVLTLLPGITGAASLVFRNEEALLANVRPDQLSAHYVSVQLPKKAAIDWQYAEHAGFLSDCKLLLRTVIPIAFASRHSSSHRCYDAVSQ